MGRPQRFSVGALPRWKGGSSSCLRRQSMAILRALDGTYYEVPDDQVAKFKIPPEKLKDKLGAQAPTEGPPEEGPPEGGAPSPLVNVHIYYAGQGPGGGGA